MRTIFLIMIGLNIFLNAELSKSGNVVSDSKTGLDWQDISENNSITYNWQEAINYCESLTLDTYDDWRLPNINELKTLIDRSKINPAIKEVVFEYVKSSHYWSSTSVVSNENDAWGIYFYFGHVVDGEDNTKDDNNYVRCVRDGQ